MKQKMNTAILLVGWRIILDDYKSTKSKMGFNPKFGMMNVIARRKEREQKYPKDFDNRFHPGMRRPRNYNLCMGLVKFLVNKPWSPEPGASPVVESIQTLILNDKKKKRNRSKRCNSTS